MLFSLSCEYEAGWMSISDVHGPVGHTCLGSTTDDGDHILYCGLPGIVFSVDEELESMFQV